MVLYGKAEERPSRSELVALVKILQGPVENLVRKDANFKALGLSPADYVDNPDAVVDVLDSHIALLQRPVIVRGNKAIIGRPKDIVADFLRN